MKRVVHTLALLLITNCVVLSQPIQSWNTLNLKGKLSNRWSIAMEPEARYSDKLEYFHLDVGFIYSINKKLKVGGYYREIFELSDNIRVREVRPHVDVFYRPFKSFSIRIRSEYQFKELKNDLWRIRFRPTYKYAVNKWFIPFIRTEPFFTSKGFVRNRFNIGPGFSFGKLWLKPGYMLETDVVNGTLEQTHIIWVNTGLRF